MAAVAVAVAAAGAIQRRPLPQIVATVLCVQLVAVPIGAAITFGFAAAGDCLA